MAGGTTELVPKLVISECTCLTPYGAQHRLATTAWPHNSMLGTHHDRLETCHLAFTPVVGVLWVSKLDFSGDVLCEGKFCSMAYQVPLDFLMNRPARHSKWVWGTRDYPINAMATCTW